MLRNISNKKLSVGEVYGFLFALLYLIVFFYGVSHVEVILSFCVFKCLTVCVNILSRSAFILIRKLCHGEFPIKLSQMNSESGQFDLIPNLRDMPDLTPVKFKIYSKWIMSTGRIQINVLTTLLFFFLILWFPLDILRKSKMCNQ